MSSPLASPRELGMTGRVSRRNSGWGEVSEEDSDVDGEGEKSDEGRHEKEKGKEEEK